MGGRRVSWSLSFPPTDMIPLSTPLPQDPGHEGLLRPMNVFKFHGESHVILKKFTSVPGKDLEEIMWKGLRVIPVDSQQESRNHSRTAAKKRILAAK